MSLEGKEDEKRKETAEQVPTGESRRRKEGEKEGDSRESEKVQLRLAPTTKTTTIMTVLDDGRESEKVKYSPLTSDNLED